MENNKKELAEIIRSVGERFPKKHGEWYRLKVYDNNYLLLDTWNGCVYHHLDCEPSDTNNMYGVVYVFSGFQSAVNGHMNNFWYAHINHKIKCKTVACPLHQPIVNNFLK